MPQIQLIWLVIILLGIIFLINALISWAIHSHHDRLRLRDENQKIFIEKTQKDNLIQTLIFAGSFKSSIPNHHEPARFLDICGPHNGKVLSDGELQVLNILVRRSCEQKSTKNKDIAEDIFLSKFTVRNHVAAMLSKTGCTDRTQLVSWAMTNKIVELKKGVNN
jgi:DNA-binding CsgD family transcriptional regulator